MLAVLAIVMMVSAAVQAADPAKPAKKNKPLRGTVIKVDGANLVINAAKKGEDKKEVTIVTDAKTVDRMYEAFHDSLTGLASRALFLERIGQQLAAAATEGSRVALLFVDLDRFKEINDTLGHAAGDQVLMVTAERIKSQLRAGDIPLVGRTEAEVSADIGRRLRAEGHERVNFAIVGSGPNSASPHHQPGRRVIERGESVVCDFGGTMDGYCSDITRTVFTGEPPADFLDLYTVLEYAQAAAVAAARVGTPCEDVDGVARSLIEGGGFGGEAGGGCVDGVPDGLNDALTSAGLSFPLAITPSTVPTGTF